MTTPSSKAQGTPSCARCGLVTRSDGGSHSWKLPASSSRRSRSRAVHSAKLSGSWRRCAVNWCHGLLQAQADHRRRGAHVVDRHAHAGQRRGARESRRSTACPDGGEAARRGLHLDAQPGVGRWPRPALPGCRSRPRRPAPARRPAAGTPPSSSNCRVSIVSAWFMASALYQLRKRPGGCVQAAGGTHQVAHRARRQQVASGVARRRCRGPPAAG